MDGRLTLRRDGEMIQVCCTIDIDCPVDDVDFLLAPSLHVSRARARTPVMLVEGEMQPVMFSPPCRQYTVRGNALAQVTIEYAGTVEGWCNHITDDVMTLSGYSSWFPRGMAWELDWKIYIEDMEDWFVLNATLDERTGIWVYGGEGYDTGNIIALREGTYLSVHTNGFSVYTPNSAEVEAAERLASLYRDIIAYYGRVFGEREPAKLDIVSLGRTANGAYFRRELLFTEGLLLGQDEDAQRLFELSLLGHELGHNWFLSADTSTWEDWLNETGANWASYLYALDAIGEDAFAALLAQRSGYDGTPAIRTQDGTRPAAGVHQRGTALLHQVYLVRGREGVLAVLHAILAMEQPTTGGMLDILRAQGEAALAAYLEAGLDVAFCVESVPSFG